QTYGARPLDQAGRDEYVAQTAEVARRLGAIDPPTSEAELAEVMTAFRPELTATDHAREAVSYLIWHPALPAAAKPAYGVLVTAAIDLMPRWTRRPLGLPPVPLAPPVVRGLGHAATRTIRWAMRPSEVSVSSPTPHPG
ncbi:MAG: oxygenase MpaB family protein, partial [Nocardioides sp.]